MASTGRLERSLAYMLDLVLALGINSANTQDWDNIAIEDYVQRWQAIRYG